MEKLLFSQAFALAAHIDGVVFKFDTPDEQHRQRIATRLRELVQMHYTPADTREHDRLFKVKVFNMTADRSRAIVKFSLYGGYALALTKLPAALAPNLFELHLKAYAYGMRDEQVKPLYDKLIWSQKGRQPTLYGQHPNPNSKKGSGVGVRIGDRNSDYGFVFYKRPSQRLGLELRIKDKACFSRTTKAIDIGVKAGWEDSVVWQTVLNTLCHAASTEFVRDVRGKGVDLAEFMLLTEHSRDASDAEPYEFTFRTDDDDDIKTWSPLRLDF